MKNKYSNGEIMREDNQKQYFPIIKEWLEKNNYKAIITGDAHHLVIPIWDIFPIRSHVIPDVIGYKENPFPHLTIVEVETKLDKIFEAIGKCMIWKTIASIVFLAYPEGSIRKLPALEKLGLGLISVSENEVREIISILPKESLDAHKILELHPLYHNKEQEIIRRIKNIIEL